MSEKPAQIYFRPYLEFMEATLSSLGAWYALAVAPGRERKIREHILDLLERNDLMLPELSIVCPEEEIVIDGPQGETERKRRTSMPGYLLVHCRRLSEDVINTMVRVAGVTQFLGGNERPSALAPSEVDRLVGSSGSGGPAIVKRTSLFNQGDEVRIMEGPLADFTGKIIEINNDTGMAQVEVEIFGRATPTQVKIRSLKTA